MFSRAIKLIKLLLFWTFNPSFRMMQVQVVLRLRFYVFIISGLKQTFLDLFTVTSNVKLSPHFPSVRASTFLLFALSTNCSTWKKSFIFRLRHFSDHYGWRSPFAHQMRKQQNGNTKRQNMDLTCLNVPSTFVVLLANGRKSIVCSALCQNELTQLS